MVAGADPGQRALHVERGGAAAGAGPGLAVLQGPVRDVERALLQRLYTHGQTRQVLHHRPTRRGAGAGGGQQKYSHFSRQIFFWLFWF